MAGHVAHTMLSASHGSFLMRSSETLIALENTSPSLAHAPLAAIVQTPGTAVPGPVDSGGGVFWSIVPRNDKDLSGENQVRIANLLAVGFIDQRPHKGIVVHLFTRRNT